MKERKNHAVWSEPLQNWVIRVQRDGIRRAFYSSVSGPRGQIDAEKKADAWLRDGFANGRTKYRQIVSLYLEALQDRQRRVGHGSAQYIKMESISRIWVLPVIGQKNVDRITNADYQKCVDRAFDAGKSKKTLQHIVSLFSGVYRCALKNQIRLARPEFIEVYETAPTYPRDAMSNDDIRTLFSTDVQTERGKTVRCAYIHAFRIMCLLGLRRGETAALKWSDIDGKVLHVQRSINNLGELTDGKTKAANRRIFLFPLAAREFALQRVYQMSLGIVSPWVFANQYNGMPDYDGLGRVWSIYCRSNGIDGVTMHELRHTNISLAMGKINADNLKPIVGHTKSMDTFGVYGHETESNMIAVGSAMQTIFSEIIPPD